MPAQPLPAEIQNLNRINTQNQKGAEVHVLDGFFNGNSLKYKIYNYTTYIQKARAII